MPYGRYYRRYYRPRWTRPRRYFRWRRPRSFLRRRHYRRRRYRVRRKLKYLPLKEWQPKTIRNCTIKGTKCLFMAGQQRFWNNYGQYQKSIVPEHWPGGGGCSILVFSLTALYEEYENLRNKWTTSNKGLPLVRYRGCTLKFYRDDWIDYVVTVQTCFPMTATEDMYLSLQPYIMLQNTHKIIVPAKKTIPNRRPYIKRRFGPPKLMTNKWYFQQDICRTNLLLISTSACSLNHPFLSPTAVSNCVTILALDANVFKNKGWQHPEGTTGYQPNNNLNLFGLINGHLSEQQITFGDLVFLGNPKDKTPGRPRSKSGNNIPFLQQDWGNPFYPTYITLTQTVYKTNKTLTEIQKVDTTAKIKNSSYSTWFTKTEAPLLIRCRYCPDNDDGTGNIAYLLSNYRNDGGINPPGDPNTKIEGYPLWLLLWSWTDWIKKLAEIHHVDTSYFIVIQTDKIDPKLPYYIFWDESLTEGKGPYGIETELISLSDNANWYPKLRFQVENINNILMSGPATPKTQSKSIEAHVGYNFRFKWGGCPAPMQDIYDPCSQTKYPIPNTLIQGPEITHPETSKFTEIYDFDERRQTLTKKAAKRLAESHCTPLTGKKPKRCLSDVLPYEETSESQSSQEASSEEEEKTQTADILKQYQYYKRKLHRRLKRSQYR
nr:MAG: ORF1 [TTV-like mini virus]